MFGLPLAFLFLLFLNGSLARNDENPSSAEQLRGLEIDEMIKSLEQRLNTAKEAYEVLPEANQEKRVVGQEKKQCDKENVFQVNPNPRDRTSLKAKAAEEDRNKRKNKKEKDVSLDEMKKKALKARKERTLNFDPSLVQKNDLSDFERDEQYYRSLLRLQNLYRLYNKRYHEEPAVAEDARPLRHCHDFSRQQELIQASKMRYVERSKLLADRIAETAMQMVNRKAQVLDGLCHPCGCSGRTGVVDTVVAQPVVVAEAAKRRDVEVSAASSSATAVDANVSTRDVSVDSAVQSSSATAASVGSSVAGSGAAISSSSAMASDALVGSTLGAASGMGSSLASGMSSSLASGMSSSLATGMSSGLASGMSSGLATGMSSGLAAGMSSGLTAGMSSSLAADSLLNVGNRGYLNQLGTCEDYERKMVMDMAIEESAGMIRKLAMETSGDPLMYNDPDFERRVLGMAIDLVNKVTVGVAGGADVLSNFRYNNVDDYLKSSILDNEMEVDLVSNSGFDYVNPNIDMLHDFPRSRCDSCSKYDLRMGGMCPLCKRSSRMFERRAKRRNAEGKGRIYHLENVPGVQTKVYIK